MIDWWSLFTNLLWALGLAISLALFSQQDWRGSYRGESLWTTLRHLVYSPKFAGGLVLTCLGAGLSGVGWAERLLWFLLAAVFAAGVGWAALRRQRGAWQ